MFMAVFKAYFWESLAPFTPPYIPFPKTETESQLTLPTERRGGWWFPLARMKMLPCAFDVHTVKWSWQWPPSCLIGLWTKFWMRSHTAIINWWVPWTSWVGLPLSSAMMQGRLQFGDMASFLRFTPSQPCGPRPYLCSCVSSGHSRAC